VVLRGPDLDPAVCDTDPQMVGVPPVTPTARTSEAEHTAEVVAEIDRQARAALAALPAPNPMTGLLLRGFDSHQELPTMADRYGLTAAAAAVYPMYRGLARLVGMEVLGPPADLSAELTLVADAWTTYDYFFVHHKGPDSAGEDGDFDAKVAAIEALDAVVPDLVDLGPDVLMVTGDHATPSQMAAHSWHPVPVLMWGARVGRDPVTTFGEGACLGGALGRRPASDLMTFALAAAGRLAKYGA
jgi:2,3-bisphosphoglycerate-independent phosphoglycerate mutase